MDNETRVQRLRLVINEFLRAFDKRWEGETSRKRSNAVSPSMENAIAAMRKAFEDTTP